MALTTFGSIMGFAADMFRLGEETLQAAAQNTNNSVLQKILQDLAADQPKSRSLMERARREHVTEMMLEPINGLRQEEYEMNPELHAQTTDAELLTLAITIQEKQMKFLNDCSVKIPLPEVSRIFQKIAREKEKNLMKLKTIKS